MHDNSRTTLADSPATGEPLQGRIGRPQRIIHAAPAAIDIARGPECRRSSRGRAVCAGPSDTPRQLTPAVLQPTSAQWSRFSDSDCTLLAGLLRERIDYADNPLFHERNAEERLFGKNPAAFDESTQVNRLPRNANGTLTSSYQTLLFQQFNFARRRQVEILWRFRGKRIPMAMLRTLLRWARAEMSACNTLTEANLPLVLAMCKNVRPTDVDINDLMSEGSLALLRCVKKFDCSRGFQFSTYACSAILKSFWRAGRQHATYRFRFPVEFSPAMERGDSADGRHNDAESVYLEAMGTILRDNRAELNDQEFAVIRIRFGLGEHSPDSTCRTLSQVGAHIGVSKERARQVQNTALQKLRAALQTSHVPFVGSPPMGQAAGIAMQMTGGSRSASAMDGGTHCSACFWREEH